ncbi:MAG: GerW family sporulation protein [Lachnospiraceae bacterium]|nr:GerW family sporulation protein [Lachnospiraceae bacterium]
MSKANEEFNETVGALFKGMDTFLSTKTVVGEPIVLGDTTILPLVNVSFGVGAGVFLGDKKNNGAGGLGGKMTPGAVLIIHNGQTRLINVSTHTGMDKLLDMIPDFVDKFKDLTVKKSDADPATKEKAAEAMRDMLDKSVEE